jgi:tetratricopeptide (TPR) repeat protein
LKGFALGDRTGWLMMIRNRGVAAALFAACLFIPARWGHGQTFMTVVSIEVSGQRVEKVDEAIVVGTGIDDGHRVAVTVNQNLAKGTRIRVPALTRIQLRSAPGNEITLFPQTRFAVLALDTGETYAACGQALFDVRRLLQFFNVSCEGSFASVRGTKFLWNADSQEIKIDVDEGTVSLSRDVYAKVSDRAGELLPTTYRFPQKQVVREFGNLREAMEFYKREQAAALEAKDAARLEKASLGYGKVLLLLGDAEGARQQYEQALNSAKTSQSPKVEAWALNNLGITNQNLGQLELAQDYYQRSLVLRRTLYEPVHVEIAQNLNNLGILYRIMGNYCGALKTLDEAQEILRRLESHDYVTELTAAKALLTLAAVHGETMHHKNAMKIIADARSRLEKLPLNTDVAAELANSELALGIILLESGQYSEAVQHEWDALQRYQKLFGNADHPAVANAYDELGRALVASGNAAQGIDYLNKSMQAWRRMLGNKDNRNVSFTLQHLGEAYELIKHYDDAARAYSEAGGMRRRLYGPAYPLIAETLLGLARVERVRNRYAETAKYYPAAADILRKTYRGSYHPNLAEALQGIISLEASAYSETAVAASRELQALLKVKDEPLNCAPPK